MKQSKTRKILLAVATSWPVVYLFGLISVISRPEFLHAVSNDSQRASGGYPVPIQIMLAVSLLTALEIVALEVVYIGHVLDNDRLSGEMKAIWGIIIFFGAFVGMGVYWFMFIWPERSEPLLS